MRVTLLGHASLIVEMDGAVCLMDPVFFDPFEEGAVVSCPKRTVLVERLPRIDLLVVSHRHPDHFDIRSLAQVGRDCDAICPPDPLIVYALKRLGFARVHPVHPMGEISSPDFELYPTRSEATTVREFGMVFHDKSGTFWNQVDTFLSDQTVDAVRSRFATIDLMFATYASQNFEFFDSLSASFPFETHRRNLENVIRTAPRMAVPGSAGFRFCGDHAWLNAFLFPISAERFVSDLNRLDPSIATRTMTPGDVFDIANHEVRHLPGASPVARTEENDTRLIDFDPTAPIPDLCDPNPDGYSEAKLAQLTERFVIEGIGAYVEREPDRVLALYRENCVRYAIGIVLPGPKTEWYGFHFGPAGARLERGEQIAGTADVRHRIAASALAGWVERRKSFFYVRAYSRRFSVLYRFSNCDGRVRLERVEVPDLLMHYILNVAPGSDTAARRHVDLELEALGLTS